MKNFGENPLEKRIKTLEEKIAIIDAAIERSGEIRKTLDDKNGEWNEISTIFDGLLVKVGELRSSIKEPKTEEEWDDFFAVMDRVNVIYDRIASLSEELESTLQDVDKLHNEFDSLEKRVQKLVD